MKKTILSEGGLPRHIEVREQNFMEDEYAFIEAIPGVVFAVVISYVYLNVGTYMNGTLGSELVEAFGDTPRGNVSGGGAQDWLTDLENKSANTMTNLSGNYDDNVNIIKVAITISVLLVPVMTIMTLRRFT
jgi:hypothetical protein